MSALEKGIGFELKLVELFEDYGYNVTHNIKMTGKSGAQHQIDVLAQYDAPLHTSTVIIEAKSYEKNIDKDIIMKLVQIQQDLYADRAILATTSDFTPGALQTAQQYDNIELWNRTKIVSLMGEMQLLDTANGNEEFNIHSTKVVDAKLSQSDIENYANESAAKRSKGGFLGKGKIEEKVKGVKKFLYPYYDVDLDAKVREVEKTGWRSKEEVVKTISTRVGIDGNTGALINVASNGIFYGFSFLSELDDDEIYLLYYVSEIDSFEKRNLSAIGWTTTRINKVVSSLSGKGLLVMTNARPATYASAKRYPSNPAEFVSLMETYPISEDNTEDTKADIQLPSGTIPTMLQSFWVDCNVKSIDLLYYPYYIVIYQRPDGSTRHEILDGISGTKQDYLDRVISTSITES